MIRTALLFAIVCLLVFLEEAIKFDIKRWIWTTSNEQETHVGARWYRPPVRAIGALNLQLVRLKSGVTEYGVCVRVFCRWKKKFSALRRGVWTKRRSRGLAVRSLSRSVVVMLLLISEIEPNPGPFGKLSAKPKCIEQWIVWNINEAFSYASVGADAGFVTRVKRLLKLCQSESLEAPNLCEAYRRI